MAGLATSLGHLRPSLPGLPGLTSGAGGGYPPPAPPGYGYLFKVDNNGVKQLITITDANGVTRPIYVLGGS